MIGEGSRITGIDAEDAKRYLTDHIFHAQVYIAATELDRPSVWGTGPTQRSLRAAVGVIKKLEASGLLGDNPHGLLDADLHREPYE